jgi:hypothetical protein
MKMYEESQLKRNHRLWAIEAPTSRFALRVPRNLPKQ